MTRVLRKQHRQSNPSPLAAHHEFVIGPAGQHDPFEGKGQRYTCIRCKWAFVVKGREVVVLDDGGIPMPGEHALARLETFSDGPCPGNHFSNGAALQLPRNLRRER